MVKHTASSLSSAKMILKIQQLIFPFCFVLPLSIGIFSVITCGILLARGIIHSKVTMFELTYYSYIKSNEQRKELQKPFIFSNLISLGSYCLRGFKLPLVLNSDCSLTSDGPVIWNLGRCQRGCWPS